MVRDALIIATERRFENLSGNHVLVQFLTDNGAAYTSISTQTSFADWG
jgi:transposase InsO family protein